MIGMRRVRVAAAVTLLAALGGAWIATSRVGPRAGGRARIQVEYSRFGAGRVSAAYKDAIGSIAALSRSGGAGCARGIADERAWSRPAEPRRVAGRFACRSENGRAEMWWTDTDRGVLAHAVSSDRDLASLFEWWLSHSER